ncbi:hypothetical protein [Sphingobacterium gobiense]|uniref:DNA alkylation repair protein n=1 Tax=Sphingobacterium gobiense TaxID=1382456 RepID=A0A2S9JSK8_9SPHI|nr:hypothetical protein [Sphingobacterium gobiense]PRD56272.1 hypothetical protein C5749_03120 [Sphingobacterium gobiense]
MANSDFDPILVNFLKVDIRQYPAKVFSLGFIHTHGFTVSSLLAYSYHPDNQVSFRAAWLLEHVCMQQPNLISSIYDAFITQLPKQTHWGTIRSYTKIAMLATDTKTATPHSVEQEEILVEQCFHWLIYTDCPVAVVVNCLDILYNLRKKNPWIEDELKAQIQYLLKNPTPALASRAKRVLKKMV